MQRKTVGLCAVVVGAICLALLVIPGTVVSDDHGEHDVSVNVDDPVIIDESETIAVTVENPTDADLIFPLVEVPLDGLDVEEDDTFDRADGEEGLDGVTATHDGETEDRDAFINDSTFQGDTDALFIEGENVPAESEVTYEFDLTIDTSAEIDMEVDVRSLNDEDENVRISESIETVGAGTIDATFTEGEGSITVLEDGSEVETDDDSLSVDVPGGESYEVLTDGISILEESVSLDVTPSEFGSETVEFADIESADEPHVIASSSSSADAIQSSTSRSIDRGTAETNTVQHVEFDLAIDGSGETHLVVEDEPDLPMRGIDTAGDFGGAEWHANDSLATMTYDGDTSGADLVSLALEGYPLGDVTTSGDVTENDATEIATMIAEGNADDINEYGDVTADGDVSAADAMKIQQYHEENRDADYGGD